MIAGRGRLSPSKSDGVFRFNHFTLITAGRIPRAGHYHTMLRIIAKETIYDGYFPIIPSNFKRFAWQIAAAKASEQSNGSGFSRNPRRLRTMN